MGKRLQLKGKRFGLLTVLSLHHKDQRNNIHWNCECDCGNFSVVNGKDLNSNHTKSCGCQRSRSKRKGVDGAAKNEVFNAYKYGAKKRGYDFLINKKDFFDIVIQNCYYCNRPPSNTKRTKSGSQFIYSGLDRLNNDIGYQISNIVPCCRTCNVAKNNMSYADFKDWITQVFMHLK
jgi:hypothetical protein